MTRSWTISEKLRLPPSSTYAVSAAAALTALLLVRTLSSGTQKGEILPSPRKTVLPTFTPKEAADLPYPPDLYPGTRDVETPYGCIRVYEWGPEDGKKVLLVHGISTPCIALGGVAEKLVERGCRVMLFDLFGRGYSDFPADLPADDRLYMSQILLVLASSPLPWGGSKSFSLVGYSLGGAISVNFTSYFPHLVDSLILLAPGGLIRPSQIAWSSKLLYSRGLMPEWLVQWLIARRLRGSSVGGFIRSPPAREKSKDPDAAIGSGIAAAEVEEGKAEAEDNPNPADNVPLVVKGAAAVSWQLENHAAFVPAFISSIRYGPSVGQQQRWSRVGAWLKERREGSVDGRTPGVAQHRGKVLMILGQDDPIIVKDQIIADASESLGPESLEIEVVKAGHDLAMTKAGEIGDLIWRFLGEGRSERDA